MFPINVSFGCSFAGEAKDFKFFVVFFLFLLSSYGLWTECRIITSLLASFRVLVRNFKVMLSDQELSCTTVENRTFIDFF